MRLKDHLHQQRFGVSRPLCAAPDGTSRVTHEIPSAREMFPPLPIRQGLLRAMLPGVLGGGTLPSSRRLESRRRRFFRGRGHVLHGAKRKQGAFWDGSKNYDAAQLCVRRMERDDPIVGVWNRKLPLLLWR